MQSPMAQETPLVTPAPGFGVDLAPDAQFQQPGVPARSPQDEEIESDWSDVEERKPQPVAVAGMELEEGHAGEIKSKHEIKLLPFGQTESDSEREARYHFCLSRLGVQTTQGPLIKIGNVDAVVEDRIIISPVDRIILDIENFILTKDRKVFGVVEDVFGPIERPYYSVLNDQYVKDLFGEGKVSIGDALFCLASAMKDINHDRINELKKRKGCDASNKFDEEPLGAHETEDVYYSDDEMEMSTKSKPRREHIGKRDREMDEEDWSKSKQNKAKVQELKQKYSNPSYQGQTYPAHGDRLPEQQPIQATHSLQHPLLAPGAPPQMHFGHNYSSYMAPVITQMTPEQVMSYNHYLAQINMMYGMPPYAQNSYMQPMNPQPGYLPQDPNQQMHPEYFAGEHPQNPQ